MGEGIGDGGVIKLKIKHKKSMKDFGKFCALIYLIAVTTVFGGVAFMKFWEWFVVNTFHVKPLTLIESIGLVFTIRFLQPRKKSNDEKSFEDHLDDIFDYLSYIVVAFCVAYIITLFQ